MQLMNLVKFKRFLFVNQLLPRTQPVTGNTWTDSDFITNCISCSKFAPVMNLGWQKGLITLSYYTNALNVTMLK